MSRVTYLAAVRLGSAFEQPLFLYKVRRAADNLEKCLLAVVSEPSLSVGTCRGWALCQEKYAASRSAPIIAQRT